MTNNSTSRFGEVQNHEDKREDKRDGREHSLDALPFNIFTDTYSSSQTLLMRHSTHLVGVVLVVTYTEVSSGLRTKLQQLLTQVEVVVLCVTDDDEATDNVGER